MIIDARTLDDGVHVESDVCIVGAGAAGITLGRELDGRGIRVCLLESGGLTSDRETQALYAGETQGAPYTPLDAGRLRFFGGTTNHWSGRCRPLDAIDFEARDWVPNSGWPFDAAHLEPFYRRAQDVLQLGAWQYEADAWTTPEEAPLPLAADRALTRVYLLSPPIRFGRDFRSAIEQSDSVRSLLHANAVAIETTPDARRVERIRAACLDGRRFAVRARYCVLAAGGIENARLLLASNETAPAGLGNAHDLVGRYYMDHPESRCGRIVLSGNAAGASFYRVAYGTDRRFQALLTLNAETLHRERLLNGSMLLFPEAQAAADAPGFRSARYLMRQIRQGRRPEKLLEHVSHIVADLDTMASVARQRATRAEPRVFLLENTVEQVPDPENRVMLGTDRDALGMPRVILRYRIGDVERRSLARMQRILAEELGRAALGRLQVELDDDAFEWQNHAGEHHMGATRMHTDPRRGVVDADCRVHDMANLFVAGSSVFPTSGYANPTLTIVALAIRLAEHLRGLLG